MIKKRQKFNFYFESEMSKKKNVTFITLTNGPWLCMHDYYI